MLLHDLCAAFGLPIPTSAPMEISGVAPLGDAAVDQIAALFNGRYSDAGAITRAGVVLVTPGLAHILPEHTLPLICDNAASLWSRIIRHFHPVSAHRQPPIGRHPSAVIDSTAEVHESARIGPLCIIEANAHIGPDAVLHGGVFIGVHAHIGEQVELLPKTVIMDHCRIGERTRIGPGAVIGGPGFGLDAEGPIPHLGRVLIGTDASIGANTCIDRGLVGDTLIGNGAHLDNLVQIGHGAFIGAGAVLCGQVGVAGSARVEPGVVLGGQVGVADHVRIGSGVRVAAQSGVTRDLPQPGDYSGHPAEANRQRLKRLARLKRLTES